MLMILGGAAIAFGIVIAGERDRTVALGPGAVPPEGLTALDAVELLVVGSFEEVVDYERELFAYRAFDHDRNGCDTRNDVLRRDLVDIELREGTNGCVVATGVLQDPYTGVTMEFERGTETSADVQIDHVVSLANAWSSGASTWDEHTLQQFGNDPLNLLAVDGPTNQSKGSADTGQWLPPNDGYHCSFVARQVAVKLAYDLTVTDAERGAMRGVLGACPDEVLLTAAEVATP